MENTKLRTKSGVPPKPILQRWQCVYITQISPNVVFSKLSTTGNSKGDYIFEMIDADVNVVSPANFHTIMKCGKMVV
tara:strand:- start:891 stop:1121 length:231 start_codon:yes stop_codon:yes gene_type:complete